MKSVKRIRQSVREHLKPRSVGPWDEVRDRLNQKLRGWKAYFGLGSTGKAYKAIDEYVDDRVRHFLRRRTRCPSQGTRQFPTQRIYGELGVIRLRRPLGEARS